MTYHEFLRLVWRSINRPGQPVTSDSFDRAVLAGLKRVDPKLHARCVGNVCTVRDDGSVTFQVTALLRYIEREWQQPAAVTV